MLNVSKILGGVTVCVALGTIPATAGNGGTPNGKPFVKINEELIEVSGAITSLQDQVDMLVARVDTVEERVGALQTAVADVEANNVILEAMISQNATDIASINQAIADLEADNLTLQSQIDSNLEDIQAAQTKIAANESLIATLQSAIIDVENGSIDADTDLQALIDNNNALITSMQGEIDAINKSLTLKQNIINGTCPNGEVVIGVTEDSITCAPADSGTSAIRSYTTYRSVTVPPHRFGGTHATCPNGTILSGGGYRTVNNVNITSSAPYRNSWYVHAYNNNSFVMHLFGYGQCLINK